MKKVDIKIFTSKDINDIAVGIITRISKLNKVLENTGDKTDADLNTKERVGMGLQMLNTQLSTLMQENSELLIETLKPQE